MKCKKFCSTTICIVEQNFCFILVFTGNVVVTMRIVIAKCSVDYTGRGDTRMETKTRAIMIKSDGAISIHHDKGNKPLNYMGNKNVFTESSKMVDGKDIPVWNFEMGNKEVLTILMHEIYSDSKFLLPENDEGLIKDGTEYQLQDWLAEHPEELGDDYEIIGKEYQTGAGPVDLLVRHRESEQVYAVEVKRTAMLGAVGQVQRYVDALNESGDLGEVLGLIVALDVRPKTVALAEKKGISLHTIDSNWKARKNDEKEFFNSLVALS